ncbi:hypothetical protein GCM10027449_26740 [Sinomonas notoginsengisoli]|uniref:hypothetical protein n=1 Tax=Sinomonas notoginsengisoli TaxID=1457311 RepID=UPI001F1B34D3|nr:hypothetical protein [Sinomonas notoginsengisoli]
MALVMCPLCMGQEDVQLLGELPDGRLEARCPDCDFTWVHGEARPAPAARAPLWPVGGLPTAADVDPDLLARAERLKPVFLAQEHAGLDPHVPAFWTKYGRLFGEEGLPSAAPADLRVFATDGTGSSLGIQRTFLDAFDENPEHGAAQVRQVVDYLLRGTGKPLEDRLTGLVRGRLPFSFPGFKEVLLSKVLSVVHPDRFLTLLTYEQKLIAAKKVYGLDLPPYEEARIGHQIVWSNDLLFGLAGDGFKHAPHAGEFLWWAQHQT